MGVVGVMHQPENGLAKHQRHPFRAVSPAGHGGYWHQLNRHSTFERPTTPSITDHSISGS